MAPRVFVFPAALLLLSMLATPSMGTPGEQCYTKWGYPSYDNPLRGCRAVARSLCLNGPVAENAKAECCTQLGAIRDDFCKCPALAKMLGIIFTELGVKKGQDEVFPGCGTEVMHRAAASIPIFCNQYIPIGTGGVCYWANDPIFN